MEAINFTTVRNAINKFFKTHNHFKTLLVLRDREKFQVEKLSHLILDYKYFKRKLIHRRQFIDQFRKKRKKNDQSQHRCTFSFMLFIKIVWYQSKILNLNCLLFNPFLGIVVMFYSINFDQFRLNGKWSSWAYSNVCMVTRPELDRLWVKHMG